MKLKVWFSGFLLLTVSASFAGTVFPVMPSGQCTPTPTVSSDTVSNFCTIFPESVASCWPPVGSHRNFTYTQMIQNYTLLRAVYGSLNAACAKNAPSMSSTKQVCIDQWTCYVSGGRDSQGGLCSGTGVACS